MIRQAIDTKDAELLSRDASRIELIGSSDAMRRVEREALLAARLNSHVLVTGERGVGKTLVARFIHEHSDRSHFGFGTINCEGLPDVLFQSALFGCLKGRIHGEDQYKPGLLESAAGGTILLKHIDSLSPRMQARLLWFLETGEYLRVGDSHVKALSQSGTHLDVRLMASTSADLTARVAAGEFLSALHSRLNAVALSVPPLRVRRDDIPVLVRHFAGRFAGQREITQMVRDTFYRAEWPGNVQEVKSLVIRQLLGAGARAGEPAGSRYATSFKLVKS